MRYLKSQVQEAAAVLSNFCGQFDQCFKCPMDMTRAGGAGACLWFKIPADWDHGLIESRLREYGKKKVGPHDT